MDGYHQNTSLSFVIEELCTEFVPYTHQLRNLRNSQSNVISPDRELNLQMGAYTTGDLFDAGTRWSP